MDLISGTLLIPGRTPVVLPSVSQQRALVKNAAALPPRNHFTTPQPTQTQSLCEHNHINSTSEFDSVTLHSVSVNAEEEEIDEIAFSLSQLMQPTKLSKTFYQADILPPDEAKLWREAGQAEFTANLATNRAAVLVKRPPASVNILPSKVVFTHKYNSDGSIAQYKCRWTACGNYQLTQTSIQRHSQPPGELQRSEHIPFIASLKSFVSSRPTSQKLLLSLR